MARATRGAVAAVPPVKATTARRAVKDEPSIKTEEATPSKSRLSSRKRAASIDDVPSSTKAKKEDTILPSPSPSEDEGATPPLKKAKTEAISPKKPKASKAADLQSKKLKSYNQYANQSPFPDFLHPTPSECKLAHKILRSLHGARIRPTKVVARPDRAGCGDSPSVLDALIRTILSQNTSDTNSTRAKKSMDQVYGGHDNWSAIVAGGQAKLQEAIKCGGLSVVKSKVILTILTQVHAKYGEYSLDHLFNQPNEIAMAEMLSFQGVGPKTASCVLLFCLQRESFAVDTHVHRITGLLGWRPKNASRDETHQHLDVKIPDEDKYGLHILLVSHGKKCDECKASGKNLGKCELRKAFRKGKLDGEAGEHV